MSRILLLHGPNLNLLGTREPDIYGADTLDDINARARQYAAGRGHVADAFQSNAEHDLVDAVQRAKSEGVQFIIVNPAAFTHTSVALRDALLAVDIPFIEVHLSNVHAREDFRHRSYFSDVARGVISGLGAFGYDCAMRAAVRMLEAES